MVRIAGSQDGGRSSGSNVFWLGRVKSGFLSTPAKLDGAVRRSKG